MKESIIKKTELDEGAENMLREILWRNHGCGALFAESDGVNMTCRACLIDFYRDDIKDILKNVYQATCC